MLSNKDTIGEFRPPYMSDLSQAINELNHRYRRLFSLSERERVSSTLHCDVKSPIITTEVVSDLLTVRDKHRMLTRYVRILKIIGYDTKVFDNEKSNHRLSVLEDETVHG